MYCDRNTSGSTVPTFPCGANAKAAVSAATPGIATATAAGPACIVPERKARHMSTTNSTPAMAPTDTFDNVMTSNKGARTIADLPPAHT